MIPDIPSPLLRSFVAVVDCGSLAAAAKRLSRSESALSLQMSRLEDVVGQSLFSRTGRGLQLNQGGSLLLAHARAILGRIDAARAELGSPAASIIRIGIVQDFVGSVLRPALSSLRALDPMVNFNILIGGTAELLRTMGEDRIDTVLCAGSLSAAESSVSFPMEWFGEADLLSDSVLPLVTVSPPCPFLSAAQHALDAHGISWRLAVVTPSLEGVRAAVAAGLGIACRTVAGMNHAPIGDGRLPILPSIGYTVLERRQGKDGAGPVAAELLAHLREASSRAVRLSSA